MMTSLINHSERLSVPKRSQEPYRKGYDSSRESTMNDRESAMATVLTCYNSKMPAYKNKNCIHLKERPDKSGNPEND